MGVNPRGTEINLIWQMDVTQYPMFNPWKYLHVSVDTFSGFILATPQRGEATKHVINHCIRTFSVLGKPAELKTDNGPAYCSEAFSQFCDRWTITHKFGIPYNSQGQAIVERAHQTLKTMLDKLKTLKGEMSPGLPGIQNMLNIALYTINFLNLNGQPPSSAASRHFSSSSSTGSLRPLVLYRKLPDPAWRGPGKLITWGRGYAAIETTDGTLWVPGRMVKPYHPPPDDDKRK